MAKQQKRAIEIAREYAGRGLQVLPTGQGRKTPSVAWTRWQTERVPDRQLAVWFTSQRVGYFLVCGLVSGVCVLDCDTGEALDWWRAKLGDIVDSTACVKTSKGWHLYFRLPEQVIREGKPIRGRARHTKGSENIHWDFRCDGGGVVMPPSIHESGHVYSWVEGRGLDTMLEAPAALLFPGGSGESSDGAAGGDGAAGEDTGVRSMLVRLLENVPGEGGRNEWLVRVAGHYAKAHARMRDLYVLEVNRAAAMLEPPLPEKEVLKTLESIWQSEQAKGAEHDAAGVVELDADTGWLASAERRIVCQVRSKDGDLGVEEYADFDIRALGVVEDDGAERVYDVVIHRARQGDELQALLPARVLADPRALRAFLAEYGVTVIPPGSIYPKVGGISERLARYLESQKPPRFEVVSSLGWSDSVQGFICHEGVIRIDGIHPHTSVRPAPILRDLAPYRYGMAPERDAVRVLRELLGFHDETVCAVYGAWWAACLLKPQIHRVASQFPFMALEAPSESGKTTGFFSMMQALAGNTQGQSNPTKPALRDAISGHRSGITWIDDLDSVAPLMELLRQATAEGSVMKKAEDRTRQVVTHLVGPICIGGEALQLREQKALLDRAILLGVPNPTQRLSLAHPDQEGRLQWSDILDFRDQYPDLSVFSGTLVSMALRHAPMVAQIPVLGGGGRHGDKMGVIRMGARVLAAMSGVEWVIDRADRWCAAQENLGSENSLTLKLLPAALRQLDWPSKPERATERWPATPVFLEGRDVWYSTTNLARWWYVMVHGRIDERTETAGALLQQAQALGPDIKPIPKGDRTFRGKYRRLPSDVARKVIERSEDGPSGEVLLELPLDKPRD